MLTSEDYLLGRGWRLESHYNLDGDYLVDPVEPHDWCLVLDIAEAVTTQVQRDRDCAEFVAAYQTEEGNRS